MLYLPIVRQEPSGKQVWQSGPTLRISPVRSVLLYLENLPGGRSMMESIN